VLLDRSRPHSAAIGDSIQPAALWGGISHSRRSGGAERNSASGRQSGFFYRSQGAPEPQDTGSGCPEWGRCPVLLPHPLQSQSSTRGLAVRGVPLSGSLPHPPCARAARGVWASGECRCRLLLPHDRTPGAAGCGVCRSRVARLRRVRGNDKEGNGQRRQIRTPSTRRAKPAFPSLAAARQRRGWCVAAARQDRLLQRWDRRTGARRNRSRRARPDRSRGSNLAAGTADQRPWIR
jgi:hypothetical protein